MVIVIGDTYMQPFRPDQYNAVYLIIMYIYVIIILNFFPPIIWDTQFWLPYMRTVIFSAGNLFIRFKLLKPYILVLCMDRI